MRVKGSRPGIADTWTPAVPPAPAAETPGAGGTPDGQAAADPAVGTAEVGQPPGPR